MDQYDSDDSLGDVDSGVSTNVLLGYAAKEPTEDAFSQLGGLPTWLHPAQHPPPQMVKCKSCSDYMTLLLQLNGDLPAKFPGHERRLYIWACRKKTCRRKDGSVRAVRAVRLSKQALAKAKGQNGNQNSTPSKVLDKTTSERKDVGSALFGAKPSSTTSTNPFSSNTTPTDLNPFSTAPAPPSTLAAKPSQRPSATYPSASTTDDLPETFAQKARLSSPTPQPAPLGAPTISTATDPWPPASAFPNRYPAYYLDADYEYLSPLDETKSASASGNYAAFMDLNPDAGDDDVTPETSTNSRKASGKPPAKSASSDGAGDADDETPHDKAFLHFADTLAQNPEQVLRYEFGGSPLLYTRRDDIGRAFTAASSDATTASGSAKVTTSAAPVGNSGMPRCARCGAGRIFELQLTPHAIAELEADEEDAAMLGGEGMEWGTVILGVCGADCGSRGGGKAEQEHDQVVYVEEWVGVQWEEVVDSRGGARRRE